MHNSFSNKRQYSIMDIILEQKKKGERNFRLKIDDFLSKSPYARLEQQLSAQTIQQLLQMPYFEGVCSNGKVNMEKLCDRIAHSQPKYTPKDLFKVLGGRKQMKISQLQLTLKNYQLHQFDLQQQVTRLLFQNHTLSLSKIDALMSELGLPTLNSKDRQILIECFDYDRDGAVNQSDLQSMLSLCRERSSSPDLRSTQGRQ